MNKYIIKISETHWNIRGEIKVGNDQEISGNANEQNEHKKGFAIRMQKEGRNSLPEWVATSKRIMWARHEHKSRQ